MFWRSFSVIFFLCDFITSSYDFLAFFFNSVIDLCQSITVTVWDKIVYFASYICLHLYVQFYICSTFPSFETRFDIVFFSFYKKKNNNPPKKKHKKKRRYRHWDWDIEFFISDPESRAAASMFNLYESFGEQLYETIEVETISRKQPSRIQWQAYFKLKEANLKRAKIRREWNLPRANSRNWESAIGSYLRNREE